MLSAQSSPQVSPACPSVPQTTPKSQKKSSVKSSTVSPNGRKRKISVSEEDVVEGYMTTVNQYIKKKQTVSAEASSIATLVESTVNRLSYEKQIWFLQKVINLIAEVNNLPAQ